MNPLPLPKQVLGATCFIIAQFLSLVDHATWGNQEPQNFPIFCKFKFLDFGRQFVLPQKMDGFKVLEFPSKTSDHRTPRTSLPQESAKEMVRDWQRKLRSEVRGVDRSIRWIRPVCNGGCLGGIWEGQNPGCGFFELKTLKAPKKGCWKSHFSGQRWDDTMVPTKALKKTQCMWVAELPFL